MLKSNFEDKLRHCGQSVELQIKSRCGVLGDL